MDMSETDKKIQKLLAKIDRLEKKLADTDKEKGKVKASDQHQKNYESEEKYRTVFENTGTATTILEEDGTISLANTKFEKLSGYSAEEIQNKKTWMEFVVKEDLDKMLYQHNLRRENKEKALTEYEFRFIDKNKNIKHIHLFIDVIPGTKKSVASLLDITDRKKAEIKLGEQKRQLSTIISNLPGFVYRCRYDKNWTMLYMSDCSKKITGYRPGDFINNKKLAYNDIIHPEHRNMVFRDWEKAIKENTSYEKQYQIFTSKNEVKWVWERGKAIYDPDGNLMFLEGYIEDITQRKKAEDDLYKLKRDLEKQVDRQTKTLKERVNELERFHKATIEREFRIKELRDEIKRLKNEKK
ncbi:MAG: PAS domain-containing protein [Bacteroidota bacterium]